MEVAETGPVQPRVTAAIPSALGPTCVATLPHTSTSQGRCAEQAANCSATDLNSVCWKATGATTRVSMPLTNTRLQPMCSPKYNTVSTSVLTSCVSVTNGAGSVRDGPGAGVSLPFFDFLAA